MKTIWADVWGLVSTDRGSIGDSICFEKYAILREFSRQITRCDNSCSGFLYHAYSHLESEYVKYPFETVHIIQDQKVLQRTAWILCSPPFLTEYTNKLKLALSHFLSRPTDMRVRSRKTKLFRLAIWQRQDSKRNLLLMGSSSESTMNPISSEPSLKWQPAVDLRLQVFPLHRLHQPRGQYFRSGRFIFTSFVKTTAIIFISVFSTWKPNMKCDESNIFWQIQKEWGASLYH